MAETVTEPVGSVRRDLSVHSRFLTESEALGAVTAVLGGTWGAVEITLGGFLHALRLPFVGLVMALLQAGFFIAFRRAHPLRGLLVLGGLLAASVKLMVPSGALLAPALGIATEGLLLELAFLLFPGAWAAFFGASLALLWSILQAVGAQVVLFGWDVLALYEVVLHALGRAVGLDFSAVAGLLILVVMLAMAGLVGLWAHRLGARLDAELADPGSQRVSRLAGALWELDSSAQSRASAVGESGRVGPGALSHIQAGLAVTACLLALAALAGPRPLALAGLVLLTMTLGAVRFSWLGKLLRWRFWVAAGMVALATGLVLTASRASAGLAAWLQGASEAAAYLLVRVAILSEAALLAVEGLRTVPPTAAMRRLGRPGRAMARAWAVLPAALAVIGAEMESVRGEEGRWARLAALPGMLEALLVWTFLVARTGGGPSAGLSPAGGL